MKEEYTTHQIMVTYQSFPSPFSSLLFSFSFPVVGVTPRLCSNVEILNTLTYKIHGAWHNKLKAFGIKVTEFSYFSVFDEAALTDDLLVELVEALKKHKESSKKNTKESETTKDTEKAASGEGKINERLVVFISILIADYLCL